MDHPVYQNSGELPICPDLTFTCSGGPRGALGRTAWAFPFNAHLDYTWKLTERMRLKFVADMFNLFNQQQIVRVNQNYEVNNSPGENKSGLPEAGSPGFPKSLSESVLGPSRDSLRVLGRNETIHSGEVFGPPLFLVRQ